MGRSHFREAKWAAVLFQFGVRITRSTGYNRGQAKPLFLLGSSCCTVRKNQYDPKRYRPYSLNASPHKPTCP